MGKLSFNIDKKQVTLEEIELHGKPVSFRKVLQKSKKVYNRKRFKINPLSE